MPDFAKRALLLGGYIAILSLSLYFSFQFRFDFTPSPYFAKFGPSLLLFLAAALPLLQVFGQFRCLLSFFGVPDAQRITLSIGTASLIILSINLSGIPLDTPPRAVIVLNFILGTAGLVGFRLVIRILRERWLWPAPPAQPRKKVAVYGTGNAAAALISEILARPNLRTNIVGLFDDDPSKRGTQLHGIRVLGGLASLRKYASEFSPDELILAMPHADPARLRAVVAQCRRIKLPVRTVPTIHHLVNGQMHLDRIKPVELEDLLAREAISLEMPGDSDWISGRQVLVTGAGGTIGAELARQIWARHPRSLILVDRSEPALFEVEQELREDGSGAEVLAAVADVGDEQRMEGILSQQKPDLIFHAAAHKHVPMMEKQVGEAVANNALKSLILARMAAQHGTKDFVMISTDKAINPTNVMGASKRMAELGLQILQKKFPGMKIASVRFGNVLGSSGSVIPTFRRQIAAGGPVTVTHPEVTRYFMSVAEAVGLVLIAGRLGEGGEIFVLDMGKPVKIVSMARQLIELSGFEPDKEIEIRFTGLRPGEKLFEELSHSEEVTESTAHPKIWKLKPQKGMEMTEDQMESAIRRILEEAIQGNWVEAKQKIRQLVPEYQPWLG